MELKMKYYSLKKINSKNATYNIIFGERSNGKTYACLNQVLNNYFQRGEQFAYIRRWNVDIAPKRMNNLFNAFSANHEIARLSNNKFTSVYFRTGTFYLCKYDDMGKPIYNDENIIGYAFDLGSTEHNKANSYPKITNIIFDEFLTRMVYLNDEFMLFMNTVSTIVRNRTNVKIYMLGNTVNKYCPYFREMGLKNILNMKQGTIDVYTYGNSKLKVAVEYADSKKVFKKNNYYFAFNNPKLNMITSGSWELNLYPHAPCKWKPKNILLTYFIDFNGSIFQCEIIYVNSNIFTFIHDKTTPIKNPKKDIIFCLKYHAGLNYNRNILKPSNEVTKKIAWFYLHDRVYYQNNEIGDAVNNYLKICKRG